VNGSHAIVARRDHGIAAPEDLRGKRIATQRGSAVHFFLHVFLLRHGLANDDVTTEFLPVDDLPRALQAGTVDAASLREPYVSQTVEALGDAACVFEDDAVYVRAEVLVVSTALLNRLPAAPGALLRALLRAETFAQAEPARAAALVARMLDLTPGRMAAEWPKMSLHVALDQSLLRSLEEEARWARGSGLVTAPAVPDYLQIIDTSHLLRTKSEAVSIIR
jgi:NitT/TauT family transport system substrate-binding protein